MPANKTKSSGTETAAVKVLIWDAEVSPNVGYTWGKWETNVLEFIRERQIFCFSWKWLGEKKIHVLALPSFKSYARFPDSNRALIHRLHALFAKADVIVAHNGDKFDDKQANTDFIKNGLPPPPPHKTVDTLKIARAKFRFNSNSLDDLGRFLKLGRKIKHPGISLWLQCLEGNRKAWSLMKQYNKGDVRLLEKIYLELRPWSTNHPDMNAFDGKSACPACKSTNLKLAGWMFFGGGKRQRFTCGDCGKWSCGRVVNQKWRFR